VVTGEQLNLLYPWQVVGTSRTSINCLSSMKIMSLKKGNPEQEASWACDTKLWLLLRAMRPTTDYMQQRRLSPAHLGIWPYLLSSILLLRHAQAHSGNALISGKVQMLCTCSRVLQSHKAAATWWG